LILFYFQIKKSQPIDIDIYRIPFDAIRESVTVYLSLFCSDVTPTPNTLYKYSNAIAALVLKVLPNSDPKIVSSKKKLKYRLNIFLTIKFFYS